jgi:hypothetical protein
MILFRSSRFRFRARSSWGPVLPRRSIHPSLGWGISRIDRRPGCWLWGSLAVGSVRMYSCIYRSRQKVCSSAYILAPPPKALNHRPGQAHGERSFGSCIGAGNRVAGLVGAHCDRFGSNRDWWSGSRSAEVKRDYCAECSELGAVGGLCQTSAGSRSQIVGSLDSQRRKMIRRSMYSLGVVGCDNGSSPK